jgi:hypothetical protein
MMTFTMQGFNIIQGDAIFIYSTYSKKKKPDDLLSIGSTRNIKIFLYIKHRKTTAAATTTTTTTKTTTTTTTTKLTLLYTVRKP